jgi:uncharacterized protein YjbI with pentapeptide repeats
MVCRSVPEPENHELQLKNRLAWSRYFAANLDEETRKDMIKERRLFEIELVPFSPEELQEVATAFAERCQALANKPALPSSAADVDFSNVDFEYNASFEQYLFSGADFVGVTFSDIANFRGATCCNAKFTASAFAIASA